MGCENKDRHVVMIGGSRHYPEPQQVKDLIKRLHLDTILIHGACKDSPDVWADAEAQAMGLVVGQFPYISFHGRAGGHVRNHAMVDLADYCIFFWDGQSQGTGKTIDYAKEQGVHVIVIKPGDSIEELVKKIKGETDKLG